MMYPPQHSEPMQEPAEQSPAVPPSNSARGRWVLWLVLAVVIMVGASAGVAGYVFTRSEGPAMAVGDCVSDVGMPVEYDCADERATYRIVAREPAQWPFGLVCMKYANATRAVQDPIRDASEPDAALCLSPTRANMTDPGALIAGDCVDMQKESMKRIPCDTPAAETVEVIAIEIHSRVPVSEQACKAHAATRDANALVSLGGRAIVVCARPTANATSVSGVEVGDCAAEATMTKAPCDQPGVRHRVLSVRTQHVEPPLLQCPDDGNVNAVFVSRRTTTDLRVVVCLGPSNLDHLGYGKPGDCVIGFGGEGGPPPTLVDCADPAANATVAEVHQGADAECPRPPGASGAFTMKQGAGAGLAVCYVPL